MGGFTCELDNHLAVVPREFYKYIRIASKFDRILMINNVLAHITSFVFGLHASFATLTNIEGVDCWILISFFVLAS